MGKKIAQERYKKVTREGGRSPTAPPPHRPTTASALPATSHRLPVLTSDHLMVSDRVMGGRGGGVCAGVW
ncbi:hypothetical protein E2C01_062762 [Portunus trituberculatus]|uniref:Uncharacterized protein n=1 Tax=Portunus trituberculatus TaxID=210409 RepID=A0A5B7H8T2_PORTR|nr:hypothetical protein [Portunus trituberculatus]